MEHHTNGKNDLILARHLGISSDTVRKIRVKSIKEMGTWRKKSYSKN